VNTNQNRAAVAAITLRSIAQRLTHDQLTERDEIDIGKQLIGVADEFDAAAAERSRALSASPLRDAERATLLVRINDTLRFLGAPGDWGYGTRLADLTLELLWLRQQLQTAAPKASEVQAGA